MTFPIFIHSSHLRITIGGLARTTGGPIVFYIVSWSILYAHRDISLFLVCMASLKQHKRYFNFRSKIQLDHPVSVRLSKKTAGDRALVAVSSPLTSISRLTRLGMARSPSSYLWSWSTTWLLLGCNAVVGSDLPRRSGLTKRSDDDGGGALSRAYYGFYRVEPRNSHFVWHMILMRDFIKTGSDIAPWG